MKRLAHYGSCAIAGGMGGVVYALHGGWATVATTVALIVIMCAQYWEGTQA